MCAFVFTTRPCGQCNETLPVVWMAATLVWMPGALPLIPSENL